MSIVSNVQKGLLSVYLLFLNSVYTYIVNVLITIRMLFVFLVVFFSNLSNIRKKNGDCFI